MDETQIQRLQAALTAAVAAHRQAMRAELARQASGFELRFTLARLGFPPAHLDAVAAATSPADLAPSLLAEITGRLCVESARLLRLARVASPTYDLNRHIALRRALLWAEGRTAPDGVVQARTSSGRVLNSRFRGHRPKREQARPESTAEQGPRTTN